MSTQLSNATADKVTALAYMLCNFKKLGTYEGRLVGTIAMQQDTGWEMHPNGEEFLYVLSGAIELVLQTDREEQFIVLRPGSATVVPGGVWHRQIIREPSQLLFITPTQGTQLQAGLLPSPSILKTRLRFSHTVETSATPEQVWQAWTRVNEWANWDTELEWASLDTDFQLGAQGMVKPKSGPACPFTITEFVPGQRYTFSTRLLLCDLVERRTLRHDGKTTYVTHEVSFEGLLAKVFGVWLSKRFQVVLPQVMERLIAISATLKEP